MTIDTHETHPDRPSISRFKTCTLQIKQKSGQVYRFLSIKQHKIDTHETNVQSDSHHDDHDDHCFKAIKYDDSRPQRQPLVIGDVNGTILDSTRANKFVSHPPESLPQHQFIGSKESQKDDGGGTGSVLKDNGDDENSLAQQILESITCEQEEKECAGTWSSVESMNVGDDRYLMAPSTLTLRKGKFLGEGSMYSTVPSCTLQYQEMDEDMNQWTTMTE